MIDFLQVKKEDAVYVQGDPLKTMITEIFTKLGVSDEDSAIVADILVASDLRGVDSHGVCYNIKRNYLPGITQGKINPRPNEQLLTETTATALMDGDGGLGHASAFRGMNIAIKKAGETGVGIVSIKNSTHCGMLGYYPLMATKQDMIGIAMTAGGPPTVMPTFGTEPMLSTSPLSIGAPAKNHPAFLLDMATSIAAGGKFQIANLLKTDIPEGWGLDENLEPTTDGNIGMTARKWLPLGGASRLMGGHKGFGLGLAVDILCGVLSGEGYLKMLNPDRLTHFLMAIDISAIRPVEEFKSMMDDMIDEFHNCPKEEGQPRIYIAGEPEWEAYLERSKNGIPIHREVHDWLVELAREMNVKNII